MTRKSRAHREKSNRSKETKFSCLSSSLFFSQFRPRSHRPPGVQCHPPRRDRRHLLHSRGESKEELHNFFFFCDVKTHLSSLFLRRGLLLLLLPLLRHSKRPSLPSCFLRALIILPRMMEKEIRDCAPAHIRHFILILLHLLLLLPRAEFFNVNLHSPPPFLNDA